MPLHMWVFLFFIWLFFCLSTEIQLKGCFFGEDFLNLGFLIFCASPCDPQACLWLSHFSHHAEIYVFACLSCLWICNTQFPNIFGEQPQSSLCLTVTGDHYYSFLKLLLHQFAMTPIWCHLIPNNTLSCVCVCVCFLNAHIVCSKVYCQLIAKPG